eukprot:TRINITY_DN2667_c2_g3_i2.p1 TRINITY_DN2667_c2_g3~~TRINITY_DN2667_c2_g3_i2.p1  ORF type:complete len:191 (+),score=61.15 TRINITY_DN2667_c2_g3_i2:42-575(+)
MGFAGDSVEGLLEGHESPTYKLAYRLGMGILVLLTFIGIILALVSDHGLTSLLTCLVALNMLVVMFTLIRWYRTDGMAAKFRYLIYALMVLLLLLNIFNITLFAVKNDNSDAATPPPTVAPSQPCYLTDEGCPTSASWNQYQQCLKNTPILGPCPTPMPTAPPTPMPTGPPTPMPTK